MMGDMIRARRSAEHWERIVREQQVSGLSVAAFCRQARVPPASFYFWRKKSRGDRRLPGVRRARARGGRFVEVKVSAESSIGPATRRETSGVELRLPGRRRVVVRPGFDRRTLIELLEALEIVASGAVTSAGGGPLNTVWSDAGASRTIPREAGA